MEHNFDKYLKFKEANKNIKVGVAMSGGVDSSTVAYILKKQGYDIFGVTMKTFNDEDSDAKKVCDDLGIEHYVLDVREDFKEKVMDYFINEYQEGRTPNPCMVCNRHIKFGKLLEFIISKGANFMATGHYTKLNSGFLSVGDDGSKDQVYFLSQIKKENLKYIIFPVGDLEKSELRILAKNLGVRVYSKKDSQEICFVEDGKLKEFLSEMSNKKIIEGNIIDTSGKILGKHKGLPFYTIGQRKGINISSTVPLYVLKLDTKNNNLIVGTNDELFKDNIIAKDINLFMVKSIKDLDGLICFAKTRSRDVLHKCSLSLIEDEKIRVNLLENAVRAVTPGQGIVFYDESGKVIAGGFIE